MGFVVWKLGGSLFDLPNLAERIVQLKSEAYPDSPVVVIPGGGPFADAVREVDETHHLPAVLSHRLAMEAMRLSADFIAAVLDQKEPIRDPESQKERAQRWGGQSPNWPGIEVWDIVSTWAGLHPALEEQMGPIPNDWRLTSDSIAGVLAAYWQADRLVLCKSIDRPSNLSMDAWSEDGFVDPVFPRIAPHLRQIDWVNLRAQ